MRWDPRAFLFTLLLVTVWGASAKSAAVQWTVVDPGAACPNGIAFSDTLQGVTTATSHAGGYFSQQGASPIRWTEDGGLTWNAAEISVPVQSCESPSMVKGSGLAFATGFLSGERGKQVVLLRSEDGGRHWRQIPLPEDRLPGQNWFFDQRRGLLLAYRENWTAPVLLSTDDGGNSWQPLVLPEGISAASPLWFDFDGKQGWMGLQRTADAGASWFPIPGPQGLTVEHQVVVAADHVLLIGRRAGVSLICSTKDGGNRWTEWPVPMEGSGSLWGLSMAPDGQYGWAYGMEGDIVRNGAHAMPEKTVVLRTVDGGISWQRQSVPVTTLLGGVYAISSREAWLFMRGGYALPTFRPGGIWHTTDGGLTWKNASPAGYSINAMFFIDRDHGWAVGGYGGSPYETAQTLYVLAPPPPPKPQVWSGAKRLFYLDYTLKQDSLVSIVIYNTQGRLVRTLLNAAERPAGTHHEAFDGLADTDLPYGDNLGGPALPDGKYTWRLLASPVDDPVRLEYHMSFSGHGNPPWFTDDRTGAWSSVWGYVQDLCSDGNHLYAVWSNNEVTDALLKITPEGQKVWGTGSVIGTAIATDGRYVYAIKGTEVKRVSCDQGRLVAFGDGKLEFTVKADPVGEPPPTLPQGFITEEMRAAPSRGLAVRDGKLYVSLHWANRIAVCEADSGNELASIAVTRPSGIAFGPDDLLYALSDRSLVKMRPDGSGQVTLISTGLEDPYGLAVDVGSEIWISDHGAAQQVLHFSPRGAPLGSLGTRGGRPPQAVMAEVEADLRRPVGLCADFERVYVAEDNLLNRVVVYDGAGKLLDQWQGYTNGNDGTFVDEKAPEYMYVPRPDGIIRFRLDYQERTWEVDAYSEGWLHGQRKMTFWNFAWRMHGRKYLEDFWGRFQVPLAQPRLIHYQGETYMTPAPGFLYYLSGHELFKPLMMTGYPMWFPDRSVEEALKRWPRLDLWTANAGTHYVPKPAFCWRDDNLDGVIDLEEYQVSERPDLILPVGGWWDRQMRWHAVVDGREHVCEPTLDANGLVRYRLDDLKPYTPPGPTFSEETVAGQDPGLGWSASVKRWHLVKRAPDGSLIFRVGKKARTYAKPGEIYRSFGLATQPDDLDFIAVIDVNGQLLLYSKDGLFIARVPENDPYRGAPSSQQTLSIELFSANLFRVRGFNEPFVRMSDLHRNSIWRLRGMDKLVRSSGTVTVSGAGRNEPPSVINSPVPTVDPVVIARAAQPPTLDGTLASWPAARPLAMMTDPTAESRPILVRLAYDAIALYTHFAVPDATPLVNAADDLRLVFKQGDACEVYLGLDGLADHRRTAPVAGDTRLLLGLAQGRPFAVVLQAVAPGAPPEAAHTYAAHIGENKLQRVEAITEARVFAQPNPDGKGYVLQAAVPWRALGIVGPPAGRIRFDVGVQFGHPTQPSNQLHVTWAAGRPPEESLMDVYVESRLTPATWGDAVFAR